MPAALTIGKVGDKMLDYALKRQTNLLTPKILKTRELHVVGDSEPTCRRYSRKDVTRQHSGVFTTRKKLEKLKKPGTQIRLLYPNGTLID